MGELIEPVQDGFDLFMLLLFRQSFQLPRRNSELFISRGFPDAPQPMGQLDQLRPVIGRTSELHSVNLASQFDREFLSDVAEVSKCNWREFKSLNSNSICARLVSVLSSLFRPPKVRFFHGI